jgi:hypothetical protein
MEKQANNEHKKKNKTKRNYFYAFFENTKMKLKGEGRKRRGGLPFNGRFFSEDVM